METSIVTREDMTYLAQQSAGKLNMILSGMTALLNDNENKVNMMESQTWFQRMARTITGKNKMTQQEIQRNHEKINLYMTQAMTALYEQNCIDHQVMMSLGNQINELYAEHLQLKQMLGAFASKLNEKIESIDNFHILVTEIEQGVYSDSSAIISICKILSQIDRRTVQDDRKLEILYRSMEKQGIINDRKNTLEEYLIEFTEIAIEKIGAIYLELETIRDNYMANLLLKLIEEYHFLPDMARKLKNRYSVIEEIVQSENLDKSIALSIDEIYQDMLNNKKVILENFLYIEEKREDNCESEETHEEEVKEEVKQDIIKDKKICWGRFSEQGIDLETDTLEFINCEIKYGNDALIANSGNRVKFLNCTIIYDYKDDYYEWQFLRLEGSSNIEFEKCTFINCRRLILVSSRGCEITFKNCDMKEPSDIIRDSTGTVQCNVFDCKIVKNEEVREWLFVVGKLFMRSTNICIEKELLGLIQGETIIEQCTFKGKNFGCMSTLEGEIRDSVFENCGKMRLHNITLIKNSKFISCPNLEIKNNECCIENTEFITCDFIQIDAKRLKKSILKKCEGEDRFGGENCTVYTKEEIISSLIYKCIYLKMQADVIKRSRLEQCKNVEIENLYGNTVDIETSNFINLINTDETDLISSNQNIYIKNTIFDNCHTKQGYIVNYRSTSHNIDNAVLYMKDCTFNNCSSERNNEKFVNDIVKSTVAIKPKTESRGLFGFLRQEPETSFAVIEETGNERMVGEYVDCNGINKNIDSLIQIEDVENFIENNSIGYEKNC